MNQKYEKNTEIPSNFNLKSFTQHSKNLAKLIGKEKETIHSIGENLTKLSRLTAEWSQIKIPSDKTSESPENNPDNSQGNSKKPCF